MAAGQFVIKNTNFLAISSCKYPIYRPWIEFLNTQSSVRYALLKSVGLNARAIRAFYCSAIDRTQRNGPCVLTFRTGNNEYMVSEDDVNRILNFPCDNFAKEPTETELVEFFRFINYQCGHSLDMNNLIKNNLPNQWNFFFHTISHVFAPKTDGFHGITRVLQKIGYAVAHNRSINYGRFILQELIKKMGKPDKRTLQVQNVICVYPRFIQLILDDFLIDADKLVYAGIDNLESPVIPALFISHMESHVKFPGVVSPLTPFMQARFNQPPLIDDDILNEQGDIVIAAQEQPQQVDKQDAQLEQNEQPHVIEADNLDIPMEQVESPPRGEKGNPESDPFLAQLIEYESPVATGQDQDIANPLSLTQILEPNTKSSTSTCQPLKRKEPMRDEKNEGETANPAANKDVLVREPTALPPQKKRSIEPEASESSPVSSQQDTVVVKAHELSLVSFSQQSGTIEIRPSVTASCNESNPSEHTQTLSDLTSDILLALRGVSHTEDELTVAIILSSMARNVTMVVGSELNQAPSQALGGNFDLHATSFGSLSISPERTTLEPSGKGSAIEAGRQLVDNDSDSYSSDESHKEMPSQALEGNLGPLPIIRPSSTLPEGTVLVPVGDFPSFEDGRQLVSNKVGDLRNPIAPLVNSSEGARVMVISTAGTAGERSSGGMSETQTKCLCETQTLKPRENLEMSEIPEEPVSETLTVPKPLLAYLAEFEKRLNLRLDEMERKHKAHCSSLQGQMHNLNVSMQAILQKHESGPSIVPSNPEQQAQSREEEKERQEKVAEAERIRKGKAIAEEPLQAQGRT